MDINVCIKGVNRTDWFDLKAYAAKSGKTMGEFMSLLKYKYEETPKSSLDTILSWKPILTEDEADWILKTSKKMRKEFKFR